MNGLISQEEQTYAQHDHHDNMHLQVRFKAT